ncbi:hypothetical protein BDN72DRAFT_279152 [Pluteus cervinus]|uniref:Uncharacterized protein n=1 Tax=Pluteus cervinus TaxID=181527 RepID=A0ACD3AFD4_9AGAR|nr:hypothetical protein BDN72DRAFT_279152 [Pluteus cervinus]
MAPSFSLLISPRNTPAAVLDLLHKTSCHRLITTHSTSKPLFTVSSLKSLRRDLGLKIDEALDVLSIYQELGGKGDENSLPLWPHPAATLCFYLHSFGSIGFPKPTPLPHKRLVQWALGSSPGLCSSHSQHCWVHGTSAVPCSGCLHPGHVRNFPPTDHRCLFPHVLSKGQLPMIPSPDNTIEHIRRTKADALIIVSTLLQLQAWARSPNAMGIPQNLQYIASQTLRLLTALVSLSFPSTLEVVSTRMLLEQ